ncbi:MAG: GspH/FimT family pseudopilin [Gammaproteobacteria bacterium]|nr:GspH/FimT family pseudopilin [Gammaproteobacteria bacterium]
MNNGKIGFGFNLVELTTVLSIVSLLAYFNMPRLSEMFVSNQINSQVTKWQNVLNEARQYASIRQKQIIVCPVDSSLITSNSRCGDDWMRSILIFVDSDLDRDFSVSDKVLNRLETSELTLQVNRRMFKFAPLSDASTTAGTIKFCAHKSLSHLSQAIVISNVGRIRLAINKKGDCVY